MYCLISQANAVVIEVHADPKSIGQQLLEKICLHLGISHEADYFGLKYEGGKGEELWLNLRNPIDRQVTCHGHQTPVRLALRVKFWVPPHLLQQEKTRHQFYLHAKLDLLEKRLLVSDWDCVSRLIALIAQAESGDYDHFHPPHNIYMQASSITPKDPSEKPNDLLQRTINEHKKCKGMKESTARYWLLKEISELEQYGEETFLSKVHSNTIGVGPHGITIYEKNGEKKSIGFASIVTATSHRRIFRLEYLNMEGEETKLEMKLDTCHSASSLYRAITEKHAFYSCETVRSAVTAQFIRDLKGTIVSIFNEDSTLGKKYVFDIRRTCREVYDNARRALYQDNAMQIVTDGQKPGLNDKGDLCNDSQEKLTRLLDAMTCKICMDNQIDAVFLPCGHAVSCSACAAKCDRCPVCRSECVEPHKLFLPGEFKQQIC